jgi:outer membrane lipoprotein SlyB
MKQWMTVVVLCAALMAPAVAGAHEGHMHKALGTVARVDGAQVVIKTTDGKSLTVMLDKNTAVTRGKEKLDATAIKAGERLSVDYMEENKVLMAHAVKLATAQARK